MFDNSLPFFLATFAIWALAVIIILVILYWIIRLAVTGALKSHTRWMNNGQP